MRTTEQFIREGTVKTAALLAYYLAVSLASAGTVEAVYNSATDVPITTSSYSASGNTIHFTLNFAPDPVLELMVVKVVGPSVIQGNFDNLTNGQPVTLSYGGTNYSFVANYYGGSGNDLVLVWASSRAYGWGMNDRGQLGDNTTNNRSLAAPVTDTGVLAGKTVVAVTAGAGHSLALCSDGTVAAWGDNEFGMLGDGTTNSSLVPVAVNMGPGSALYGKRVVAVSAGAWHSLALCSDGTVAAWGDNYYGGLGDGTDMMRLVPVAVNTQAGISALYGKKVVAISGALYFSLALCSDGTVVAWGANNYGTLGDNEASGYESYLPVSVNRTAGLSALSGKIVVAIAGGEYHSLALCSDGTVAAWGDNYFGQLGDNGASGYQSYVPVAVNRTAGLSALYGKTVTGIAACYDHSLALCSDGTVAAWGGNIDGDLGDNTTVERQVPVAVNSEWGVSALYGRTVVGVAAGGWHSLAVCSDGTGAGWGGNEWGQLGDGSTTSRPAPTEVNMSTLSANQRFSRISSGAGVYALALVAASPEYPMPVIFSQPRSVRADAGASAAFTVRVGGTAPLAYQWRKDGANLADGGNVSGTATATLRLSNVLHADEGGYSVVASNVFGVVTSLVAILSVQDPVVISQPISREVSLGDPVAFSVAAAGTAPLSYQWRKDGANISWGTAATLTLTRAQAPDAGNYDVVVSNPAGSVTSVVARLIVNLAIADTFNPGASDYVYALAVQGDGKILVGGWFTWLGGQQRNHLGRLNSDGTLDTTFNPGANDGVLSLAVQADGKILVGGWFTSLAGQERRYIGRLNADGTLDATFNPAADAYVRSLAVQADGNILVSGWFTSLAGQPRSYLGRLNPNGALDSTFSPVVDNYVYPVAVQPDGKIVVGGYFTSLWGQPRNHIGRLNPNGTLDATFNPGADANVYSLAVQADGKILAGGYFTSLGGHPRNYIGRLNGNGTLDATFDPGADNYVWSLAVQADGKILAGGDFTSLGGQPRSHVGRLDSSGTPDTSFHPGVSGTVSSLALQADGKVVVGGYFWELGGQPRSQIGRLTSTGPATQSLSDDGTTITWLRGGTSPEAWRTTLEASTDGMVWSSLGAGTRVTQGWQWPSASVPPGAMLCFRGLVTGGIYNGSSWYVETITGPPFILSEPADQTEPAGGGTTFSVLAQGTPPLSYQWRKDGTDLHDDGTIAGADTADLSLSDLRGGDAGGYSVVVSNFSGSVTSEVAVLQVVDPIITGQPTGQTVNAGQPALLSVQALGTEPFSYQWRKDGLSLAGATASSLIFAAAQGTDAGWYDVVVANGYGRATSAVAVLCVNLAAADAFDPAPDGSIYSMAAEADGSILVCGGFSTLSGQACQHLGRLRPDGSLDASFKPAPDYGARAFAVQPDGKIVVVGDFTTLCGQPRQCLGRLNANGTLDTGFDPQAAGDNYNTWVTCVALQPDGKIVVGGSFYSLNGEPRGNLGRFNADGTLDRSFNPGATGTYYGYVRCLALQPDGKILVGGYFDTLGGEFRWNLGRLNADGTVDNSFNASADGDVIALAVQPDGKILVGGQFGQLCDEERWHLGRLNADGTLDTGFNPRVSRSYDYFVGSLALQTDGKILVGGYFTKLGEVPCQSIGRLTADGVADLNFSPGTDGFLYSLLVQTDGKILAGGGFSSMGGQPRTSLARLTNPTEATQSLVFSGTVLSWLRGGSSPEIWHATFEADAGGGSWVPLGIGMRTSGGWALSGVSLPVNTTIRARGTVCDSGISGWFVEHAALVNTPTEALEGLIQAVQTGVARPQPLLATLSAALASLERGDPVPAVNQLRAFQNKVRAQIARSDAALASTLIKAAQDLIDALNDPPR